MNIDIYREKKTANVRGQNYDFTWQTRKLMGTKALVLNRIKVITKSLLKLLLNLYSGLVIIIFSANF